MATALNNLTTFNGTSAWQTFIVQFESSAKILKWNQEEKLLYLGVSLKDAAADFAYNEIGEEERNTFDKLKDALADRFSDHRTPAFFQNLLERRNFLSSETTAEYATDLKRLVVKSFPTADQTTRDAIGFKQFLRGLPDQSMVSQVGIMAMPPTVDKARAALDQLLNLRDNVCVPGQKVASVATDQLVREIRELKDDIRSLITSQREPFRQSVHEPRPRQSVPEPRSYRRAEPRCYNCNQTGHISRNCPNRRPGGRNPQRLN